MLKPALAHVLGGLLISFAVSMGGAASCNSPAFELEGVGGGSARDLLCTNGEQDGGETDVDCGGVCRPCPNGRQCELDEDCRDGDCIQNLCQLETCVDGEKSPGETGMDCGGGDCPKCPPGGGCSDDDDCTSELCRDDVCVEPSCGDSRQNGSETAVDCGGGDCEGCAAGERCDEDIDCVSQQCRDGKCTTTCAAGSGDCDGDDSCETNTTLDTDNCGACGNVCDLPNAAAQCVGGNCAILECDSSWEDCDGDPDNGCEVNLDEDASNCGSCFSVCVEINGAATCDSGSCGVECDDGFADCDGQLDNGCEKDLGRDVSNCGECGNVCEAESSDETVYCNADGCGFTVCEPGFGDCDGDGECETELSESVTDCGACGNLCVAANGEAACSAGECVIDECEQGFSDCNDDYQDGCEAELAVNAQNCGECGTQCGSNCDVATGTCELDNGTGWCSEGVCAVRGCDSEYQDCNGQIDDGCEVDFTSDSGNCGGCAASGGQDCSSVYPNADAHCEEGSCEFDGCRGDWADCEGGLADGCESNLNSDAQDCGECGVVCGTTNASTTECSSGSCEPTCSGSWDACGNPVNGCTTNLANDEDNCGGCGSSFVCQSSGTTSNTCNDSSCNPVCSSGRGDCDTSRYNGCETNTNTSAANCGGCGDACSSANGGSASCANGRCSVSCGANFKNCNNENVARDGCETNVANSTANCGGCGDACSSANGGSASCSSGQCSVSCGANFKNCNNENVARDGCETDVRNDPANCGACNTSCVFCAGTTCLQHLDVTVVKSSGKRENSNSGGCGQTQLTMNHSLTTQTSALAYDHRLLVLGVGFQANGANATPCQVSYGGQDFQRVTNLPASNGVVSYVYIMKEEQIRSASNGTLTVRIQEHSSYGEIAAQLIELTGVDQTSPLNDTFQTESSSFALNPSSGGGLSVGDAQSLVYTLIARRENEPTASFRSFYESIGGVRVAAGHFFANANDAQSTVTWGGGGYSHRLSAISVQRAVTTCQTGC